MVKKTGGDNLEIIIYLIMVVLLIILNGFFVLAEFAAVKIRPTQMDALISAGDKRAETVKHIQKHLDEYLSVCQVGITLASIGLGFVGEPAFAEIITNILKYFGGENVSEVIIHSTAITVGFIIVSFLHIVFGELIPKTISIRATEKSALMIAYPMMFFRYLFLIPIWMLNNAVNIILQIFGFSRKGTEEKHSENEVRVILEQSQSVGIMSFRGLLLMENILDLETLKVKNAIQSKSKVKALRVDLEREQVDSIIREFKYSRYPLIGKKSENPIGFIHIKDLYLAEHKGENSYNLEAYVRPCLKAKENDSLKQLLSLMQRKANHMAVVYNDKDEWTGIVTLEDALEEVVGTIEEEYPLEQPIYLSEYLSPDKVILNVEGKNVIEVMRNALKKIDLKELPLSMEEIMLNVIERERLGETYVGHGLCIPHARLKDISKPVLFFVRLKTPIPAPAKKNEEILYLFIILTPVDMPRIHQKLLSRIAGIFESDFLENKLDDDISAQDLYNAISTAELTSIA